MKKLLDYLEHEFTNENHGIEKIIGPLGNFLSFTKDKWATRETMPIGKRTQNGRLAEYNVLVTEDGTAIATVNAYQVGESLGAAQPVA